MTQDFVLYAVGNSGGSWRGRMGWALLFPAESSSQFRSAVLLIISLLVLPSNQEPADLSFHSTESKDLMNCSPSPLQYRRDIFLVSVTCTCRVNQLVV